MVHLVKICPIFDGFQSKSLPRYKKNFLRMFIWMKKITEFQLHHYEITQLPACLYWMNFSENTTLCTRGNTLHPVQEEHYNRL